MSEIREAGWYWVKPSHEHPWEICQCEGCLGWWVEEFGCNKPGEWFPVVSDRIPTPDEPWRTVPLEPTDRQICAGIESYDGRCEDSYRAMLAAAPKPGGE